MAGHEAKKPSFSPSVHSYHASATAGDHSQFDDEQRTLNTGPSRVLDAVRLGLTVLALAVSIVIVGTSANNLKVYRQTHMDPDWQLNLWPQEFNLGPSIALVVCGSVMLLASVLGLVGDKVPALRYKPTPFRLLTLATPTLLLLASLIGISFFYGINSSDSVATIHSWSCYWQDVQLADGMEPDFHKMCKLAETSLYLTVVVVPLAVVVGGLGIMAVVKDRAAGGVPGGSGKGTPTMT